MPQSRSSPDSVCVHRALPAFRPVRRQGIGMSAPRLRVCRHSTCPTLGYTTWCDTHAGERERRRGSRHERGYGNDHVQRRAYLLRHLMPGTPCPVCGEGMWASQALDAGHSVDLRDDPNAVADRLEHSACNRGWRKQRDGA